jgi:hypothetical protein
LKTSKDISAWGCPTSLKTWQEWVIERRGAYSARLNAERHTSASGCSSWPTAATRDYKGESGSGRQERKGHPADTLPNAMAQWPSPVASEVRQGFQDRSRGMKGSQESLTTVVVKQHGQAVPASSSMPGSRPESWATPEAKNHIGYQVGPDGKRWPRLGNQVKNWATPDASDRRSDNCRQVGLSNQTQGKLNPRWVETLMGLPVGWTMPSCASPVTIERMNSDCSGMELCRPQQNGPSEC